jgi:putative ABC transport system substrate-binding protein
MLEIRRREFIAGLGGAAAWPLGASAQQGDRVRRIGLLVRGDENDPVRAPPVSAFIQALAGLGWTNGRNIRMDLRWTGDDINRIRALAQELVGLQPDIILAGSTPVTVALQRETRTIPIVFTNLADRVVSGIVPRLDRPSGNITGFAQYEATLGGKWLELLSEIAPGSNGPQSWSILTPFPYRFLCPHLRRRPGHLRSSQSLRPFIATERSKRPSSALGVSREAALSSRRMDS